MPRNKPGRGQGNGTALTHLPGTKSKDPARVNTDIWAYIRRWPKAN
jgi:hypothetical protein